MPEPDVLVLSTADWNRPLWTNKQHLTVQLARELPHVTYVNSLGLRRPTLRRSDIARAVGRVASPLRRSSHTHQAVPSNVTLLTPWTVPYHRAHSPVWRVNQAAVRRALRPWLTRPRSQRFLWSFSPVTYGLEDEAAATVYHCVDLLASFPGIDGQAITAGEKRLAAKGVPAIASSRTVAEHLTGLGFTDVRLWENVADAEMIGRVAAGETRNANRLVFVGNLTPVKVDFRLLEFLVEQMPTATLDLAGPMSEGGGAHAKELRGLLANPRVKYHGVLSPADMAALLGRCTVGLIPYRRSPYTAGVFPMKVFEYLAAGLAAVAMNLPSLTPTPDILLAQDSEDFVAQARSVAALPTPAEVGRRQALAQSHSWASRGAEALSFVSEALP